MQYKCEICGDEFKKLQGLSSHNRQKHGVSSKETYIKYVLNGEEPTCGCGCGGEVKFLSINKGFNKYIRGHASRVNNNWGHNKEALKKSHETQRKKYESGDLVVWNKGLTKEDDRVRKGTEKMLQNEGRSKKISESLKGRKRPKHVLDKLDKGMREYWSKDENREKQRHSRVDYMNKTQYENKTKLELNFESILIGLNINYKSQYKMCGYNFDYYLPKYDTIIEVDGDFWHCNPKKYPNGPIYESQLRTISNDNKKNLICENTNNLTLIRFWESDINNRPYWVKSEIIRLLGD